MKKMIRYIVMFALGWSVVWGLDQVGIAFKGEDDECNWFVAVPVFVTVMVLANLLDKPLRKLTGEIE